MPGDDGDRIAIHTVMEHVSKIAPAVVSARALRRQELVLRHTRYDGLTVDERLLTSAYPWLAPPSRLQALVVRRGRIVHGDAVLGPGDAVLVAPHEQSAMRFESTAFVDLEWTTPRAADHAGPVTLGRGSMDAFDALAARIDDPAAPQRATFAIALDLFRDLGAPMGDLSAARLTGAPPERDERIAAALTGMVGTLATSADTLRLGEETELSPRQLQRILSAFGDTYGLGIKSWRDLRNRWRIQIAAVLLGCPGVTVADAAAEVGYGSAPALARAFAKAGLPPPTEVRRRLQGADTP